MTTILNELSRPSVAVALVGSIKLMVGSIRRSDMVEGMNMGADAHVIDHAVDVPLTLNFIELSIIIGV